MKPILFGVFSPQAHRRIDLLTFPALVVAAGILSRRDRRAAGVVLATAAVEGAATLTTYYPPRVALGAISFRAHNVWAATHGVLVAILAALMPNLTPLGRRALAVLSVMPITMALLSKQSDSQFAAVVPTTAAPAVPASSGRCAASRWASVSPR